MTVWKGKATTGVCALIGVVFTAIGLYFVISTLLFTANATHAPGEVTAIERWGGEYRPRIKFVTLRGEEVEFTWHRKSKHLAYNVGERVTVLYNLDKPSEAVIDSFYELWLMPVVLIAIGLAGLAAAVIAGYRAYCRKS
jgi:cytochrome c oxidase assembly protein Cox11